jgi:PPK2 family polyphosphate:nucleotide phosphotransferase
MPDPILVPPPLSPVQLEDFDPAFTGGYDKESAAAERRLLEDRFDVLQEQLYAQAQRSVLIVLQAMDAGGKDGTIKKVFDAANPQGIQVTSFKAPTDDELAHDFLWRVHRHAPARGMIAIFNRSHYEDVLVARVRKLVARDVWEKRFDHINAFERLLADSGTRVLKFFLYISKDEQKRRFEARLESPDKQWKFARGDLKVREKWDDYMRAYEDVLTLTNTDYAPWHIVPADNKWYRNLVVTRAIVEAMGGMGLAFPEPDGGLEDVKILD